MNKLLDLLQKRAKVIADARAIVAKATSESRSLHPSEQAQVDGAAAEAEGINAQIHALELGHAAAPTPRRADLTGAALLDALEAPVGSGFDARRVALDPAGTRRRTPSRMSEGFFRPDEQLSSRVEGADADLDIGRLIRARLTGKWSGAEAEQELLAAAGRTDLTRGGYMVPETLSAKTIDLARAQTVCVKAGAITRPMAANETMVTIEQDPVGTWHVENETITDGDVLLGQITMTPRTLPILLKLAVELVEDAPNAANVISDLITKAIASGLDRAALFGTGGVMPLGIENWPLVGTAALGTGDGASPTYAAFASAYGALQLQNAPENLALVASPRLYESLDLLREDTGGAGTGGFLTGPASWARFSKFATTSVPIDRTVGGSSDCSLAIMGDFSQLLIGVRTQLHIETSREAGDATGSAFTKLQYWMRGYLRADTAVLYPKHFLVMSGIRP